MLVKGLGQHGEGAHQLWGNSTECCAEDCHHYEGASATYEDLNDIELM